MIPISAKDPMKHGLQLFFANIMTISCANKNKLYINYKLGQVRIIYAWLGWAFL
jgi:hypothetical protein